MYGLAFALAELFAQGQLLYPYVPCVCTTSSGTLTSFSINKWVIVSEGAGGWWKVGGRDSREHRAAGDRLLRYLGTKYRSTEVQMYRCTWVSSIELPPGTTRELPSHQDHPDVWQIVKYPSSSG